MDRCRDRQTDRQTQGQTKGKMPFDWVTKRAWKIIICYLGKNIVHWNKCMRCKAKQNGFVKHHIPTRVIQRHKFKVTRGSKLVSPERVSPKEDTYIIWNLSIIKIKGYRQIKWSGWKLPPPPWTIRHCHLSWMIQWSANSLRF